MLHLGLLLEQLPVRKRKGGMTRWLSGPALTCQVVPLSHLWVNHVAVELILRGVILLILLILILSRVRLSPKKIPHLHVHLAYSLQVLMHK